MVEKIKISNVVKFSKLSPAPGKESSFLWAVENELDADEIKKVIVSTALERCWIKLPVLPTFHSPYGASSQNNLKFAAFDVIDLDLEERKLMIKTEPDCFKSYLGELNLADLRDIYAWLVQNGYRTEKKIRVKKGYLNQLSTRLEDLANHTLSTRYASRRCINLRKVEDNNKRGAISSDGKLLIFCPERLLMLSDDAIQYWKIGDSRFQNNQAKLSPEFFKGTKSVIDMSDSTNHCILNLKESDFFVEEVLQEFVRQQKGGEFTIQPLVLRIGEDLLHDKYFQEPGKFKVTWLNNRAALAEKFGIPRKKSKFETLKLGLLMTDRLEQVQKVVKALSGQKIVLRIGNANNIGYFHLGEALSASVIEALILHLKIDYIVPSRRNLVFCEVQEKMTEEMLAFIWQSMEQNRINISFSGFQLTE